MQTFLKGADRTLERIMTTGERHFGLVALATWTIALAAMIHVISN